MFYTDGMDVDELREKIKQLQKNQEELTNMYNRKTISSHDFAKQFTVLEREIIFIKKFIRFKLQLKSKSDQRNS